MSRYRLVSVVNNGSERLVDIDAPVWICIRRWKFLEPLAERLSSPVYTLVQPASLWELRVPIQSALDNGGSARLNSSRQGMPYAIEGDILFNHVSMTEMMQLANPN